MTASRRSTAGRLAALILAVILIGGCAQPSGTRYPWTGPLVDPSGTIVTQPTYEGMTNATATGSR